MTRPDRRPALNRERIFAAGVGLADGEGLTAVTMRRLAGELDVEAMSLYHHVPGKGQLVAGMLDLVAGEIEHPCGDDWKAALRRSAISANITLARHPWAVAPLATGPIAVPARYRLMDSILACLHDAGFRTPAVDLAYHALDSHTMGFTMWEVGIDAHLRSLGDEIDDVVADLPLADLPHVAAHLDYHRHDRQPRSTPPTFEYVLDLLLDGLDLLLGDG